MHLLTIQNVAYVFCAGGVLLGVAALIGFGFWFAFQARPRLAEPASSFENVRNPDAILLLLEGMTRAVGLLAHVAGWLSRAVFAVLAIVSIAAAALAFALWQIGLGIQEQATWARTTGFVLTVCVMLPAVIGVFSFRKFGRWLSLFIALICALVLQTLWTGYDQ